MAVAKQKKTKAHDILRKSLQLFNTSGVHSVSAHDISRELGISPGNLTYHFKKKNDIISALVDQLEGELQAFYEGLEGMGSSMEEHADASLKVLKILWKYRFFFNNVMYLTQNNAKKRTRYLRLKEIIVSMIAEAIKMFISKGASKNIMAPNSPRLVADNLWYFWLSYLRLYLVETPPSKATEKGYCRFASLHMYSFLDPYYGDSVRKGFYDYLDKKLG